MRIELRDCGVTESVIFPDLDGLGRKIKQIWGIGSKFVDFRLARAPVIVLSSPLPQCRLNRLHI
jgi:hypothetical protein